MTKHIYIDELLARLIDMVHAKTLANPDRVNISYNLNEAKDQLYDLILEIIGENENDWVFGDKKQIKRLDERDGLRQEQRQKLEELFKDS